MRSKIKKTTKIKLTVSFEELAYIYEKVTGYSDFIWNYADKPFKENKFKYQLKNIIEEAANE